MDCQMLGVLCMACVLPVKVRSLICDAGGVAKPELVPLETYLLRGDITIESLYYWVESSATARHIRDMALGRMDISLRAVADLKQSAGTSYLAALLVESGVVPRQNYYRVRAEAWQDRAFQALEDDRDRRLISRYAKWTINPNFSDVVASNSLEDGKRARARSHLNSVIALLRFLRDNGLELATCPQRVYDAWLSARSPSSSPTRFINWARKNGLTHLTSSYVAKSEILPTATDDERWQWIQQLRDEANGSVATRIIGILAIAYGVPVSRSLALRVDDVLVEGEAVALRIGRQPLEMRPSLAELVRTQLDVASAHGRDNERWLFPGLMPGRPLSASSVSHALSSIGITLRPGKELALLSHASRLSTDILASLLGMSLHSASRWGDLARRADTEEQSFISETR